MNDTYSYDKEEIKEILDYAIRKIEQNISTIKDQQIEIDRLKNIFKNSNHSDFDDVYKECIENNNSMSVDIFNKI